MNSEHQTYFDNIFKIKSQEEFTNLAFFAFAYQYENNKLYREYCDLTGFNINSLSNISDIPFLPIEFFKTHKIVTGDFAPELVFKSSGTTSGNTSIHHVRYAEIYRLSYTRSFHQFYGSPNNYVILGLLPSYLERKDSSLVYMVKELIQLNKSKLGGFFLDNYHELNLIIQNLEQTCKPYILIGVSFALLDFAEKHPQILNFGVIIETGGMKGRRKEITRTELHETLCNSFNLESIHSEYGMTELLSQAYSQGHGIFTNPPHMKILARDISDPLSTSISGRGALNIIDLANLYSCSFIATDDLGIVYKDGSFEIEGRFDASQVRGCNLMV